MKTPYFKNMEFLRKKIVRKTAKHFYFPIFLNKNQHDEKEHLKTFKMNETE